jgi:hypothetical protein
MARRRRPSPGGWFAIRKLGHFVFQQTDIDPIAVARLSIAVFRFWLLCITQSPTPRSLIAICRSPASSSGCMGVSLRNEFLFLPD